MMHLGVELQTLRLIAQDRAVLEARRKEIHSRMQTFVYTEVGRTLRRACEDTRCLYRFAHISIEVDDARVTIRLDHMTHSHSGKSVHYGSVDRNDISWLTLVDARLRQLLPWTREPQFTFTLTLDERYFIEDT